MIEVEYKVRAITRYVVSRWHRETREDGCEDGGCETFGEFSCQRQAQSVCNALFEREKRHEGKEVSISET